MLTRKQQQLLFFINERMQAEGIPPSFDEMKDALDLKSKSGIHRLITALEERGFIKRLPNRARALEVLKLPEVFAEGVGVAKDSDLAPAFTPSVIDGDFPKNGHDNVHQFPGNTGTSNSGFAEPDQFGFSVPVMGRIAAGVPIAAIQDNTHSISIPPDMIGGGEHYALEVQGDSMLNAGIHDGDTVVIMKATTATLGDIVVALVDDEEATLKTFRRNGSDIALEAANPAYETRVLSQDRVKVQGKLVGLIRKYH